MSDDRLTLAQLYDAVSTLRLANAPTFDGAHYHAFISPWQLEHFRMTGLSMELLASYRLDLHAGAIFRREGARWRAKKRPMPTAREAYCKAIALEPPKEQSEYCRRDPLLTSTISRPWIARFR